MATLKQIRDKADAKLATFWQLLVAKQEAYYGKHGKYFQLLLSPETPVVDGVDTGFTVRKRADNQYIASVDFPWTDKVPFQIMVDEWTGPVGNGFKATVVVEVPTGERYTRSRTSDDTDSGWSLLVEPTTLS